MPVRFGGSARLAAALLLLAAPALAQTSPAPNPAAPAPIAPPGPPGGDPVVATVNGQPIHLSDVKEAAESLPANVRALPPEMLYPKLIDSIVSEKALADVARKQGLQNDPAVKEQIQAATDQVLDNAYLQKEVAPQVTDAALHARYDSEYAGKPGTEEVHARHILVPTEAEANDIISQLDKGADFATLAKKYSKDPGAADGGDLGFFKKDDMVPAFADAAFALKDGQLHRDPGPYAVRLARNPGAGRSPGTSAQLRAGVRSDSAGDAEGRGAEGGCRCAGCGGCEDIQSGRSAREGDGHGGSADPQAVERC